MALENYSYISKQLYFGDLTSVIEEDIRLAWIVFNLKSLPHFEKKIMGKNMFAEA